MSNKILIIADYLNGELNQSTARAVTCAQQMSPTAIDVLVLCDDGANIAAQTAKLEGVTKVLQADNDANKHPTAAALAPQIAAAAKAGEYSHVLGPNTTFGKDLMPRVAAKLGVKRYRMGYYKYDLKRPVVKQLDEFRPILKNLVALNKELGIQAVYQNHSGSNYVGAPLWDLHELFKPHDPAHVSVGFDMSHAKAEGTRAWPLHANLLRPRIGPLYVKSFKWVDSKRENCSLSEGIVDKKYPRQLIASGFTGPINLHEEYLNHRDPTMIPQHVDAIRKDIVTLKSWLGWS